MAGQRFRRGVRSHFFIEDAKAKGLGRINFFGRFGQTDLKRADGQIFCQKV
jgi:hypothetical protein